MQKIVLELFSGSKTISGVFEKNGWQSFTVDFNPHFHPQLCCNISEVLPGLLPKSVDFIWASPACTYFSRLSSPSHWLKLTNAYRQYSYFPMTSKAEQALTMLQSTIKIISWFPKIPFVIENPIGRMHHTDEMRKLGHYRYAVNYADFGFPYSKETYLFSNLWLPFSTKKVCSTKPGLVTINSKFQRSIVPPGLIQKIIDYALS